MPSLIRATSLEGVDNLIEELGGNLEDVLKQCDIKVDFLKLEQQYISYRAYANLLEYCANHLQSSDFGIRLANKQNFDILGPIALVAKTGTTVHETLHWVLKFLHVHCPALSLKIIPTQRDQQCLLSFEILLQPLPKTVQVTELTMALAVNIIRTLSNQLCQPMGVYLPTIVENNKPAYARKFGCEILGYRNIAGIILKESDLQIPIDHQHLTQLSASLSLLTARGAAEVTLVDKVVALTKPLLAIAQCSNDNVASALKIHPRQLHRQLIAHHTSFIKIKDGVRKSLADHYLCESDLPLWQISELLGYQEQSAFSAASRRWFNMTARQVRQHKQTLRDF